MKTKVINIKSYRENLTKLWKESRQKNERLIVTSHAKPIFEVFPVYDDVVVFNECEISKKERYALAEKSFRFWNNKKDEDIFNNDISL